MKKRILLMMLLTVAAGVLAAGLYYGWLLTPPPMPVTAEESLQVIASSRYARLPDNVRDRYMERMIEIGNRMSPQERAEFERQMRQRVRDDKAFEQATRQAREDWMIVQARRYVGAEPMQKRQILDQAIGMMEMGRRQWEQRPREPDSSADPAQREQAQQQRDERRRQMQQHMQERIERGNPQRQAYVQEFFKDMMQRRKELGLDPLPMPPRPR